MKAKLAVLCVLTLTTLISFARAQESWTKMRIIPVDRSGSPIGDAFLIPCEGSRCRGTYWLNLSRVSFRFEALALFAPGRATIALEPVPNASGQVIYLSKSATNPIVLPTNRLGFGSKIVDLVEQYEARSIVKHPVQRNGFRGRIRIDVVGPRGD